MSLTRSISVQVVGSSETYCMGGAGVETHGRFRCLLAFDHEGGATVVDLGEIATGGGYRLTGGYLDAWVEAVGRPVGGALMTRPPCVVVLPAVMMVKGNAGLFLILC